MAPGEASDPSRSRREASRRARSALRRFCTRHQCDRLWTLTFAIEPEGQAAAWGAVENFRKRLEKAIGQRIPVAIALDFGEQFGRVHFHMALPRYVVKGVIEQAWGLGFVDARRIKAKSDGKREQARMAAAYLASYVSEESDLRELGRHRYSLTRGLEPVARRSVFGTLAEAIGSAAGLEVVWVSSDSPEWCGPPVYVLMDVGPPGGGG